MLNTTCLQSTQVTP